MVKFFKIGLLVLLALFLVACATQNLQSVLKNTSQNTLAYLNPQTENKLLLTSHAQQQAVQDYLAHYFSPWTGQQQVLTQQDIQQAEMYYLQKFSTSVYWSENQHAVSAIWLKNLANNMQMITFPNRIVRAITIHTDNLRVLPTVEPLFNTYNGYPFDQLQQSLVTANIPVLVLQTSRDAAWDLVLTHFAAGWLPSQDIALVDKQFIKQWQTKKYVVAIKDGAPIIIHHKQFVFSDRLGSLHPVVNNKMLIAVANSNNHAVIKEVFIKQQDVVSFPIVATQKNIALITNQLLGHTYGWGGLYDMRDCSATIQDLFAVFGVWLPRNSHDQARVGQPIDLTKLNVAQKAAIIQTTGVPFFSLIGKPGHIMLYIGERNGQLYILHDMWETAGDTVGGTVITPLSFYLARANYLSILTALRSS